MAKTTKKTEIDPKAIATIIVAKEIEALRLELIEAGGEIDDETLKKKLDLDMSFEEKMHSICLVHNHMDADIEAIKRLEDAARARRKAYEASQARLKKYQRDCMMIADVKSLKTPLFSMSLVSGRSRCVINDEKKLPFDLVSIVELVKPKTDEIKKILESGAEIPGATLEYGEDYIMIRTAGSKQGDNDNE